MKYCAIIQCTGGQTIHQCSFSPFDSSVVCLVGRDCVKYYRLVDSEMRLLTETIVKDHNFISHCWLRQPDDHVIAGADNGSIVLFRSGEKAFHLTCCSALDTPIASLTTVPGGFVAGVNPGKFMFFNINCGQNVKRPVLNDENFNLVHTIVSELSKREATSIAINPSEDKLCAITADGQLLTMPLHTSGSTSIFLRNSDSIGYAVTPFHTAKAIVGLDVCAKKSLFVTVGRDYTFRAWSIKSHKSDLVKEFGEEMFSVALHPAGLHVAIAFLDKLRLYHILLDDLRLCVELPVKCCRVCVFSQGGNLLATANGNIISVFDSHSGDRVVDLRGHNRKVRSLHWLQSGTQLLSCGQDGMVYLWNLNGPSRTAEFVKKRSMFTSVVIAQEKESRSSGAGTGTGTDDHREESVFVVGSDKILSELKMPDLTARKHHDVAAMLTHLVLSTKRNILLASAGDPGKPGYVKAYTYPITGDSNDFKCLGACITALQLTPDGQFLLIGDEAGCIALFEITEKQDRTQLNAASSLPDLMTSPFWRDEVLVTRTELDDRTK